MLLQDPLAAIAPTLGTAVLSILAGADAMFTAPQIHRILQRQSSVAGIRKALVPLTEHGLVAEVVIGKTHAYSLNRRHILAEPLLLMVSAKDRLLARIRELVETWPVQPVAVVLFGSAARGDMRADSDIDILVVFTDNASQTVIDNVLYELVKHVSDWVGNDVRPLVYRAHEVVPAPIFDSIASEGITIFGDSSWVRRAIPRHKTAS